MTRTGLRAVNLIVLVAPKLTSNGAGEFEQRYDSYGHRELAFGKYRPRDSKPGSAANFSDKECFVSKRESKNRGSE